MNINSFRSGKGIDAALQIVLPVLVAVVRATVRQYANGGGGSFMILLFTAGALQVCSYLTWLFITPRGMFSTGRKLYGFILVPVLLVALFVWGTDIQEYEFELGFAMLFIGPILGLYYLTLTLWEASRGETVDDPVS